MACNMSNFGENRFIGPILNIVFVKRENYNKLPILYPSLQKTT